MRVVARREPEMTRVLRAVTRLLHRAQHHRRNQVLLRPAPCPLQQPLQVVARWPLAARHPVAQCGQEIGQLLHPARIRRLVDPVNERRTRVRGPRRDRLVREEHEVLDEAVTLEPENPLNIGRLAGTVEDDPRLRKVEI